MSRKEYRVVVSLRDIKWAVFCTSYLDSSVELVDQVISSIWLSHRFGSLQSRSMSYKYYGVGFYTAKIMWHEEITSERGRRWLTKYSFRVHQIITSRGGTHVVEERTKMGTHRSSVWRSRLLQWLQPNTPFTYNQRYARQLHCIEPLDHTTRSSLLQLQVLAIIIKHEPLHSCTPNIRQLAQ